jgi:hypothetical protein
VLKIILNAEPVPKESLTMRTQHKPFDYHLAMH